MSSKSTFKKAKLPPPPDEPRALDVIEKEAQQLMWELAQVEYHCYIYGLKAGELKTAILKANQEGAARKQLDEAAAKAAPAPEVTNKQS